MTAYVYILKDENHKYYIGSTADMDRRLRQHELGHTQTTRNMKNPRLVLSQEVTTLALARKVEVKLKKLKRKDYIDRIVADGYVRIAK